MEPQLRAPSTADLVQHYGLVLTTAYLFVSAVGATYYLCLFGSFGLNAFDWWDLSDFFLAAFRRPVSVPLGITALYLGWMIANPDAANRYVIQRWPRFARWTGTTWMYERGLVWRWPAWAAGAFGAFWFLLVILGLAQREATSARAGHSTPVVWQVEDAGPQQGHLLATTSRYVLVVTGAQGARRLVTLPQDSLRSLVTCGERHALLGLLRGDAPPCPPGSLSAP